MSVQWLPASLQVEAQVLPMVWRPISSALQYPLSLFRLLPVSPLSSQKRGTQASSFCFSNTTQILLQLLFRLTRTNTLSPDTCMICSFTSFVSLPTRNLQKRCSLTILYRLEQPSHHPLLTLYSLSFFSIALLIIWCTTYLFIVYTFPLECEVHQEMDFWQLSWTEKPSTWNSAGHCSINTWSNFTPYVDFISLALICSFSNSFFLSLLPCFLISNAHPVTNGELMDRLCIFWMSY